MLIKNMTENGLISTADVTVKGGCVTKNEIVIFTACSANYLDKALAMCRSALLANSTVDVVVLLVDTRRPLELHDNRINVLWAEELEFPEFLQCAFKYNIIELNTALKPFAALCLLDQYRKVIYLDPDVCVFSPLLSVISSLDESSAVFTPHALSPYVGEGRPSDQDLLRFGCFNLGFFAVNDSESSRAMLSWWHKMCLERCFYEPQIGLGVDQKWIDLAPAFFEGVKILKDPGLNVAFWNLHERQLLHTAAGWVVNEHSPLGFVHFSSFVESDRSIVADKQTRHVAGTRPDFASVGDVYRNHLRGAKSLIRMANRNYGFANFDCGKAISPTLRRIYAGLKDSSFKDCKNPFDAKGQVYEFARRNRLLSSKTATIAPPTFKVAAGYKNEQRLIAIMFRLILFLLGPDRYFALMRYLGHYSSILNQTDMFKR